MSIPVVVNKFGKMQGWNSVTANLLGRDLEGISEIDYDDDIKKENIKGAGQFPIGRGHGEYNSKCSLTLFKEEIDALKKTLPPGKSIKDIAPFDIVVEYEAESGVILKDRIRNVEFLNDGATVKQGDMSIGRKYDMIISHIEWNVI